MHALSLCVRWRDRTRYRVNAHFGHLVKGKNIILHRLNMTKITSGKTKSVNISESFFCMVIKDEEAGREVKNAHICVI